MLVAQQSCEAKEIDIFTIPMKMTLCGLAKCLYLSIVILSSSGSELLCSDIPSHTDFFAGGSSSDTKLVLTGKTGAQYFPVAACLSLPLIPNYNKLQQINVLP